MSLYRTRLDLQRITFRLHFHRGLIHYAYPRMEVEHIDIEIAYKATVIAAGILSDHVKTGQVLDNTARVLNEIQLWIMVTRQ